MHEYDLELIKLGKTFPGGTVAVREFDLQVKAGEFITFVGPSGCGKTTTLRMIAGHETISSGQLLIKGEDFTTTAVEKRPTATIFQNYAIFPHMTVRQNIEFGLEVRNIEVSEVKRRVDKIMENLQLEDVADAREKALSGGQKQRVALARGLVTEPDILLLDEPLGALDANLRKSIQAELKLLQRTLGITFVLVTHAQSEALSMGDRVVVMNAGKVEQISSPYELYMRPNSPFVAEFIGRNTMIGGELVEINNNMARISSKYGTFSGVPNFDTASLLLSPSVILVVPSEFIQIRSLEATVSAGDEDQIQGKIISLNQVGRMLYVEVEIDDEFSIRLETYADQMSGLSVETGKQVNLCWKSAQTTVVLQAP